MKGIRPAKPPSAPRQPGRAPWLWAAIGLMLGALAVTLAWAPARWLTDWIERLEVLQFQAVRGSVWRGSAQLSLTNSADAQGARALPGRLVWRIKPQRWGLQIELQADCCMATPWVVNFQPRWNGYGLALGNHTAQLPAAWLSGLGAPWNTLQPAGQIVISSQNLTWQATAGQAVLGGELQIEALALSSRLSHLRPLGSYRLTIAGGTTPNVRLQTLNGALQLSGQGQWVGGRLRFGGEASAQPPNAEALSNLLNIVGRRDGLRSLIKLS